MRRTFPPPLVTLPEDHPEGFLLHMVDTEAEYKAQKLKAKQDRKASRKVHRKPLSAANTR